MNPKTLEVTRIIIKEYQNLVDSGMLAEPSPGLCAETSLDMSTGDLSSLALIQLVVQIEETLDAELHLRIDLSAPQILAATPNPFGSIASLADYIVRHSQ
jgi:acyl carrier protein